MGGTRTADPRVKRRESDPLHHDASNKNNDNADPKMKSTVNQLILVGYCTNWKTRHPLRIAAEWQVQGEILFCRKKLVIQLV